MISLNSPLSSSSRSHRLKRLGNGEECPSQLLFVRDRRVLTEEAFDSLWRLSHTSSL